MFSREERLSTKLFDEVMAKGSTFHTTHLSLRVSRLDPQRSSRFSCVVSKKVAMLAVKRNLVKRRLRTSVKKLGTMPPGSGCIFFAKKGILEIDQPLLDEEVGILLKKALKLAS